MLILLHSNGFLDLSWVLIAQKTKSFAWILKVALRYIGPCQQVQTRIWIWSETVFLLPCLSSICRQCIFKAVNDIIKTFEYYARHTTRFRIQHHFGYFIKNGSSYSAMLSLWRSNSWVSSLHKQNVSDSNVSLQRSVCQVECEKISDESANMSLSRWVC